MGPVLAREHNGAFLLEWRYFPAPMFGICLGLAAPGAFAVTGPSLGEVWEKGRVMIQPSPR